MKYKTLEMAATLLESMSAQSDLHTDFKGKFDPVLNDVFPAATIGNTYLIDNNGTFGGENGINVEIGDFVKCIASESPEGTGERIKRNWSKVSVADHSKANIYNVLNPIYDVEQLGRFRGIYATDINDFFPAGELDDYWLIDADGGEGLFGGVNGFTVKTGDMVKCVVKHSPESTDQDIIHNWEILKPPTLVAVTPEVTVLSKHIYRHLLAEPGNYEGLDLSVLKSKHICRLIEEYPGLARVLKDCNIKVKHMIEILGGNLSLAADFNLDKKYSSSELATILIELPMLIDNGIPRTSIIGKDWINIIYKMPEFIIACDFDNLEDDVKTQLLKLQPNVNTK